MSIAATVVGGYFWDCRHLPDGDPNCETHIVAVLMIVVGGIGLTMCGWYNNEARSLCYRCTVVIGTLLLYYGYIQFLRSERDNIAGDLGI